MKKKKIRNTQKKKKKKKQFNEFISQINELKSSIEKTTEKIKYEMETDLNKKEELKKREEIRKKNEEERIKKLIKEKEREAKIKKIKERQRREQMGIYTINGTVREKLIKAGNNFEKIKIKVQEISNNRNYHEHTSTIIKEVNDELNKFKALNALIILLIFQKSIRINKKQRK